MLVCSDEKEFLDPQALLSGPIRNRGQGVMLRPSAGIAHFARCKSDIPKLPRLAFDVSLDTISLEITSKQARDIQHFRTLLQLRKVRRFEWRFYAQSKYWAKITTFD
jgi:hypothetical protein